MPKYLLHINGANYPLTINDQSTRDSLWSQLTRAWAALPADVGGRFQEIDVVSPDGTRATLRLDLAAVYAVAIMSDADEQARG